MPFPYVHQATIKQHELPIHTLGQGTTQTGKCGQSDCISVMVSTLAPRIARSVGSNLSRRNIACLRHPHNTSSDEHRPDKVVASISFVSFWFWNLALIYTLSKV